MLDCDFGDGLVCGCVVVGVGVVLFVDLGDEGFFGVWLFVGGGGSGSADGAGVEVVELWVDAVEDVGGVDDEVVE